MYALAGLGKDYDTVSALFEFSEKPLTLNDLLPRLLAAEQRVAAADRPQEHHAMQASPSRPEQRICYFCGKTGHIQRYCLARKHDQPARHVAAFGNIAL